MQASKIFRHAHAAVNLIQVFVVFFQVYPLDQRNRASTQDTDPVILGKFVNFVILLRSFLIKQRL
ncbi:hypothetical protein B9Z50_02245 [Limnohabitans sp. Bal53]|nr:hypothetical protein B9Z50_02245 [Limnohabitans sp. Bal53]